MIRYNSNSGGFVVLVGYIVGIGPKQTRLNSPRSGIYSIKWKDNRLPEGVKIGARVCVFGELVTFDLGRTSIVVNGVSVSPTVMRKWKKFVRETTSHSPSSPT